MYYKNHIHILFGLIENSTSWASLPFCRWENIKKVKKLATNHTVIDQWFWNGRFWFIPEATFNSPGLIFWNRNRRPKRLKWLFTSPIHHRQICRRFSQLWSVCYLHRAQEANQAVVLTIIIQFPVSFLHFVWVDPGIVITILWEFIRNLFLGVCVCVWKSRDLFQIFWRTQYLIPREQRVCWNIIT